MASLETHRPAPSGTKAQLLDVAEQLFLAHGLGVSVRDVTDAAGQNGAAIHYHFGSRAGLGRLISQAADAFNMPELFAGVVILAVAGIVMTAGFSKLETRLVPWTKE